MKVKLTYNEACEKFPSIVATLLGYREDDTHSNARAKHMAPEDLKWSLEWCIRCGPGLNTGRDASEEEYVENYWSRCLTWLRCGHRRYWSASGFEEMPDEIKNYARRLYQLEQEMRHGRRNQTRSL